ncbi:MAG: hypothetical protein ACHP8A_16425, partial [Terriglobales bacterium]
TTPGPDIVRRIPDFRSRITYLPSIVHIYSIIYLENTAIKWLYLLLFQSFLNVEYDGLCGFRVANA